jgi:hypothetical protein
MRRLAACYVSDCGDRLEQHPSYVNGMDGGFRVVGGRVRLPRWSLRQRFGLFVVVAAGEARVSGWRNSAALTFEQRTNPPVGLAESRATRTPRWSLNRASETWPLGLWSGGRSHNRISAWERAGALPPCMRPCERKLAPRFRSRTGSRPEAPRLVSTPFFDRGPVPRTDRGARGVVLRAGHH